MALVPFPGPTAARSAPDDDPDDDLQEEAAGGKMSFLEHLDELRRRLVVSASAIAVGVLVGFAFINRIFDFIMAPASRSLPPGGKLIYTEPGEAFSLHIKIAALAGLVLAAPFIMYQVWMFIAPGLYSNEKRFAIPFVLFSTIWFVAGAAFNHYIAFPAWAFFASYTTDYWRSCRSSTTCSGCTRRCCSASASSFRCRVLFLALARWGSSRRGSSGATTNTPS